MHCSRGVHFSIAVSKDALAPGGAMPPVGTVSYDITIIITFDLPDNAINSLRPSDAYMRQWTNHHWFR